MCTHKIQNAPKLIHTTSNMHAPTFTQWLKYKKQHFALQSPANKTTTVMTSVTVRAAAVSTASPIRDAASLRKTGQHCPCRRRNAMSHKRRLGDVDGSNVAPCIRCRPWWRVCRHGRWGVHLRRRLVDNCKKWREKKMRWDFAWLNFAKHWPNF